MKHERALNKTLQAMKEGMLHNVPGYDNRYKALLNKISVEDEDFMDILMELEKDEYATYVPPHSVDPRDIRLFVSASITEKGKQFLRDGGYVVQKLYKIAKIVGTVVAGLFALLGSIAVIMQCQREEGNAQPKGPDTTYSSTAGPDHRSASSTMDRR